MNEEWEGKNSLKFRGSKRVLLPKPEPLIDFKGLLGETNIGLEQLNGKKHFEPKASKTVNDWRPCFKKSDKIEVPAYSTGIKKLEPEYSKVRPRAEKRHILQGETEEFGPEYRIHMKTVFINTGQRIQELATSEYDFRVSQMGRKIRIEDEKAQRNGLGVIAPGDKPYKKPEHSSGFYKEEGLVTGSTISKRVQNQGKSAANNDFATVLSYDATNPSRTKWKDREKAQKNSEDTEAMRQLIEWEKTILKESNPKYVDPDISDGD